MRFRMIFRAAMMFICLSSCVLGMAETTDKQPVADYSKRMVESQGKAWSKDKSWDYVSGLVTKSILKCTTQYPNDEWSKTAYEWCKYYADKALNSDGSFKNFKKGNIDNIASGKVFFELYDHELALGTDAGKANAAKYKAAAEYLYKYLRYEYSRITKAEGKGGFYHKNIYPNQMWLDGLYMGAAFYAEYLHNFAPDDTEGWSDIANQFITIHKHSYDASKQLNYHGWSADPTDSNSFWAKKSGEFVGCSSEFWGRGMGWYFAALVDVLEVMPKTHANYNDIKKILADVAAGLKRWQDQESGVWFQLLQYDETFVGDCGKKNYLEASASCMFTYSYLKALRLGLIDEATYRATAKKAYQGVLKTFVTENSNKTLNLNHSCKSAGLGPAKSPQRDGSASYYLCGSDVTKVSNEGKSIGPFIMANLEWELALVAEKEESEEEKNDTIRWWDLSKFSDKTITNLAADTKRWQEGWKNGKLIRYANNVSTDGGMLIANDEVIAETNGLFIGKGIPAGNLLLRHAMGESQNGMQMQSKAPITIKNLKEGQRVLITLKSSSTAAQGISYVSNLEGECGEDTYPTTYFKTYTFTVASDGDVSWTNSGGVVLQTIGVLKGENVSGPQVATPVITLDRNTITITCATEGAEIWYTLMESGAILDYAQAYNTPVELNRSCTVRAIAQKEGMRRSEIATLDVDIPLTMPFESRPFILDPEALDRGAIVTYTGSGNNYLVNWRWLTTDPADVAFNVYRDGTKLNDTPLTTKTNYLDNAGSATANYTVETLSGGFVVDTSTAMMLAKGWHDIVVDRPAGRTNQSGSYEYVPGDCMVADVDGDKQYEVIMKWDPSDQHDNSHSGYTGNVLIDAYRMDGTKLWRIDLGRNIRAGAHYTQLMVYDLDGDGKAEVACKTAPGTVDGIGKNVIMGSDDPNADFRTSSDGREGIVISGPEYLTVFSGLTGEELATTAYLPARNVISSWGDSYGNRSERYLACVAYLNGERPSLVMCRGYYTAAYLWAVDFDGKSLSTRWLHSSVAGGIGAYGEGAHSISVADVDGDLRDEIIYGACALDDDGTILYRTGLGHGDALHVGDFAPDHKGLEVMMVHEITSAKYGVEMHEALTGNHISGVFSGTDVGRGLCADIDPNTRGAEYWSAASSDVYSPAGDVISTRRPEMNFRTYWDGDLQEELTERGKITKWTTSSIKTLVDMPGKYGVGTNLIKATPCLQADIFGDWREEQIYYDNETKSHLMIFSTPYASDYRVPTLMHDHHYRMATVWQTAAYNQPPHISFYLPDYIKNHASGIDNVIASDCMKLKTVRYYNMLGQSINKPLRGVFIEEAVYADGTIRRTTRMK